MDYRQDLTIGDAVLVNFIHLKDEEKESVRRWRNHERIRKWMYQQHEISVQEHAKFLAALPDDAKNYYWLVKNAAGDHIGVVSINRLNTANGNAYLGIYANPENKAKGAGKTLIQCLKHIAFNIFKLHTLKLEVIAGNEHTIDFYHRSGFMDEGILKEYVRRGDNWLDVLVMGIINGAE